MIIRGDYIYKSSYFIRPVISRCRHKIKGGSIFIRPVISRCNTKLKAEVYKAGVVNLEVVAYKIIKNGVYRNHLIRVCKFVCTSLSRLYTHVSICVCVCVCVQKV